MTITQVALSNTFNEFRLVVNEIGNTVLTLSDGTGNVTADFLSANVTSVTDLTVSGNLTVQGTETILNTSTLTVEDKNIVVANGAADASAANGAGLTIDGAGATLEYISANDDFQLNKSIQTTGNVSASYLVGSVVGSVDASGKTVTANLISTNSVNATDVSATDINTTNVIATTVNSTNMTVTSSPVVGTDVANKTYTDAQAVLYAIVLGG